MVICMKAIGSIISNMVSVHISMLMELLTKGVGLKINRMAMEKKNGQMGAFIKVNI